MWSETVYAENSDICHTVREFTVTGKVEADCKMQFYADWQRSKHMTWPEMKPDYCKKCAEKQLNPDQPWYWRLK